MRTRVFENYVVQDTFKKYHNGNLSVSQVQNIRTGSDVMTDFVSPNFKARIARGEVINNPMGHTISRQSAGGGSYTATQPGRTYTSSGGSVTLYQSSANAPPWDSQSIISAVQLQGLVDECKKIALSKLDRSAYPFGEDLAEVHQTVNTIRDANHEIYDRGQKFEKSFRDFYTRRRRGRILNKAAQLALATETASKVWLMGKFGYGNILQTVIRAFQWMERPPGKTAQRRTARAFKAVSKKSFETFNKSFGTGYDIFTQQLEESAKVSAYILYWVDDPLDSFPEQAGLQLKDTPKVLWQILPASWVIDQFYNVSNALSGLRGLADPELHVLAAGVVTEVDRQILRSYVGQVNPGWTVTVVPDVIDLTIKSKNRSVWYPTVFDLAPTLSLGPLKRSNNVYNDLKSQGPILATDMAYGISKLKISSLLKSLR